MPIAARGEEEEDFRAAIRYSSSRFFTFLTISQDGP